MNVVIFCHSLLSDWDHGSAHFLRGVACELVRRGHRVSAYEPRDSRGLRRMVEAYGPEAVAGTRRAYPLLRCIRHAPARLDLDQALDGAGLVLVHEGNDPELVRRIGAHRAGHRRYRLLFHDTHHRGVTRPEEMARYDLAHYDGVLASGSVLRDAYLQRGWAQRAWTWHEAADVNVFRPAAGESTEAAEADGDPGGHLVWVGNWGDGEERSEDLGRFLLRPAKDLGLEARVYGVGYPRGARLSLARAGIGYGGWIPNFEVPRVFGRYRVTVHVPRRAYARALPGTPSIRPFEALACGIPLVSAPWADDEGLFTPGRDYLVARTETEMCRHLRAVVHDGALAAALRAHGLETVLSRHTCAHRVDQLLAIHAGLYAGRRSVA